MGLLQEKLQRQWGSWYTGEYDQLEAAERFLGSSSESEGSIEDALEKTAVALPAYHRPRRDSRTCWLFTLMNTLMLGITVTVASLGMLRPATHDQNACVKATSSYSPVLSSKPIEYHQVQLNGTLWPGENPAWSRKEPGDPEAEAMWESFEEMPTFPITREEILALGKDPETAARFPDEEFGLGDEAYIASLDVLHKIHCLNELRKMTFADYGEDTPTKKGHGRLWWVHLRHCVDMLAQDAICHADADLITYRWMDTQDKPFPDFSINRQCRNLDTVLEYRDEHMVDMQQYVSMEKPESGATTVPMEPGYYVAYGFAMSELYPDGEGYEGPWPNQDDWFGFPPTPDSPPDRRK